MSRVLGRWRATYTPGVWLVLSGPTSVVVLDPASTPTADFVSTLWLEVLGSGSIGDLAARLAQYRIDEMPSFAAFFWGADGMRSLVRGDVSVVDLGSGDVVADGEGIQTWTETGLGDLTQVRVDLHPAAADGVSAAPVVELPLVAGVVLASSVVLDAGDDAVVSSDQDADALPAPDDEPEPLAEQTPEPGPDPEPEPEPDDDLETARTELMSAVVAPAGVATATEHEGADTQMMAIPEAFASPVAAPAAPAVPARPTVAAVFCPWEHPNDPAARACRLCGEPVAPQSPRQIAPPALALLRASNGDVAPVDRAVMVGRAPSAERSRDEHPHLLCVSSPSHDISRTHLEVAPDGWRVTVTDLHSTNGTVVVAPNGTAQSLGSGETVVVQLGAVIELADGVSVVVDLPQ